jgi:hypothetical protein
MLRAFLCEGALGGGYWRRASAQEQGSIPKRFHVVADSLLKLCRDPVDILWIVSLYQLRAKLFNSRIQVSSPPALCRKSYHKKKPVALGFFL